MVYKGGGRLYIAALNDRYSKMVYKGGGRLYIAALNDRYRENEES